SCRTLRRPRAPCGCRGSRALPCRRSSPCLAAARARLPLPEQRQHARQLAPRLADLHGIRQLRARPPEPQVEELVGELGGAVLELRLAEVAQLAQLHCTTA